MNYKKHCANITDRESQVNRLGRNLGQTSTSVMLETDWTHFATARRRSDTLKRRGARNGSLAVRRTGMATTGSESVRLAPEPVRIAPVVRIMASLRFTWAKQNYVVNVLASFTGQMLSIA